MLDFTEQAPSTELPPASSPDTPTVSDNHRDTNEVVVVDNRLATEEQLAATVAKLAPYLTKEQFAAFLQTEKETEEV